MEGEPIDRLGAGAGADGVASRLGGIEDSGVCAKTSGERYNGPPRAYTASKVTVSPRVSNCRRDLSGRDPANETEWLPRNDRFRQPDTRSYRRQLRNLCQHIAPQ